MTSFHEFGDQNYTETFYLPLKHYFGGSVRLILPKEQAPYSDVPLFDQHEAFLNSKYAAFDLVDLLGYSLLLSDYREGSLLARANNSNECESAILSAQIGLIDKKISSKDIRFQPAQAYDGDYQLINIDADFEPIYQIMRTASQKCSVDAEVLTLEDIELYRDIQKLMIKVKGQTKYIIELDQRKFDEKSVSPNQEILSLNSKRVSFVMAADICKSRPSVLLPSGETWPLADYRTPPPESISLCSAVASAYTEGQAPLDRTLHFHSIASYVEAFLKKEGELPFQREVIDFLEDINPPASSALRDGNMYYSIIEQSCNEESVESCQVYQILISNS